MVAKRHLVIGNRLNCCQGTKTWSRGDQSSIIDFVILDNQLLHMVKDITIDEDHERWTCNSDHAWIRIQITGSDLSPNTVKKEPRWNIHGGNWDRFAQELEESLAEWEVELTSQTALTEDFPMDNAYHSLTSILTTTGQRTIGYLNSSRRWRAKNVRLTRLLRKRAFHNVKYKKACKKNLPSRGRRRMKLLKVASAVICLRKMLHSKRSRQLRAKGALHCGTRLFWDLLSLEKKCDGPMSLRINGKMTTNPQEIKHAIYEHWALLGQSNSPEVNDQSERFDRQATNTEIDIT